MNTNYNANQFANFLSSPKESIFYLDLSSYDLISIIEKFIEIKSKLSPNYKQGYCSLIFHLKNVEADFGVKIMPIQINEIFWNNFVPYLYHQQLSSSTINKICGQLKTVLNWSSKHGVILSSTYDLVKVPSYTRQQIALTPDEISRIYWFDVKTINKRGDCQRNFKRIKDMFVLSCNLGQRFSDMVRIDRSCFNNNFFSIVQQKTGTLAKVDMNKFCIDINVTYKILEEYRYKAPYIGDLTNYDKYLKELLRIIGFDDKIKTEQIINSKPYVTYTPKWQMIGSHTARRSFATININRGYKEIEVRKATGHKSEMTFDTYVKI